MALQSQLDLLPVKSLVDLLSSFVLELECFGLSLLGLSSHLLFKLLGLDFLFLGFSSHLLFLLLGFEFILLGLFVSLGLLASLFLELLELDLLVFPSCLLVLEHLFVETYSGHVCVGILVV